MQGRSWMAALTLAAGLVTPAPSRAGDSTAPKPNAPADVKPKANAVKLVLSIRGLGKDGCDVEIKPGHPGCKFEPLTRHVGRSGAIEVELDDIEIKNADRDCSFAITLREPGQAEVTTYRGIRVSASAEKGQIPVLPCYLTSRSRIARLNEPSAATKR